MGYKISLHFFVCGRYPVKVGSPLGVLDHPHSRVNQINIGVLLTIGTWDGQISEQLGNSHALDVQYKRLHDIGRETDPIRLLGDHISVLPA